MTRRSLFTILTWRHAEEFAESRGKVPLVVVADSDGDQFNGQTRGQEQIPSVAEASLFEPLLRGLPGGSVEEFGQT